MQKYTWLSTSLFCPKINWRYVLCDGIKPFLKSNSCRKYLVSCLIEFNYLGGENIRFSLLTQEENIASFIACVDSFFKNYFFSIENNKTEQPSSSDRVFLPFPANTIQYGLYTPVQIIDADVDRFSIPVQLSVFILEALKEEDIDDEIILTFGYYLSMSLIKTLIKNYPAITSALLKLYEVDSDSHVDLDTPFIKSEFEKNRAILFTVADDIINHRIEQLPGWVQKWTRFCDKEMKKEVSFLSADDIPFNFHRQVSFYIHKQLGINENTAVLLSWFIKKTLVLWIEDKSFTTAV